MGITHEQRHAKQERMAHQGLPRLHVLAEGLNAVVGEVFDMRVSYDPFNGAHVMALTYVEKQREHLRSMRLLLDAKQHRDAYVIARTMIEGMGRLLWAFSNTPERTDLWFHFGAVLDWRQVRKNEAIGMDYTEEEKAKLKEFLDEHGTKYYWPSVAEAVAKAKESGATYEIPEDPWVNKWTRVSVQQMFTDLGADPLYDQVYGGASEWIHWGVRSVMRAAEETERGTAGFTGEDWALALHSLQLGCQSLLQSLEILDNCFSLGITERLRDIDRTMVTIQMDGLEA